MTDVNGDGILQLGEMKIGGDIIVLATPEIGGLPYVISGMVAGLSVTSYYMFTTQPWLRTAFGITSPIKLWWDIDPISAGIFGVPVGFVVIFLVSWVTRPPSAKVQALVEYVRYPDLKSL